MKRYFWECLICVFFCAGCAPANLQEVRYEAATEMKQWTEELKKIETLEDVRQSYKRLKSRFNRIADLLMEIKRLSCLPEEHIEPLVEGEMLFAEFARIYEIPGARSIIEAAQEEAVHRLDKAFSKRGK